LLFGDNENDQRVAHFSSRTACTRPDPYRAAPTLHQRRSLRHREQRSMRCLGCRT
jgi:hypothetical protein